MAMTLPWRSSHTRSAADPAAASVEPGAARGAHSTRTAHTAPPQGHLHSTHGKCHCSNFHSCRKPPTFDAKHCVSAVLMVQALLHVPADMLAAGPAVPCCNRRLNRLASQRSGPLQKPQP